MGIYKKIIIFSFALSIVSCKQYYYGKFYVYQSKIKEIIVQINQIAFQSFYVGSNDLVIIDKKRYILKEAPDEEHLKIYYEIKLNMDSTNLVEVFKANSRIYFIVSSWFSTWISYVYVGDETVPDMNLKFIKDMGYYSVVNCSKINEHWYYCMYQH